MPHLRFATLAVAVFGATLAGCTKSDPPRFKSNLVEMERNRLPDDQRKTVATIVEAMFGTPDEPFVPAETGLDLNQLKLAAGPVRAYEATVATGGLFRQHCVHCHGVTGDGMGPTAAILNPYPRDYRPGLYKYKSTERASMPTDADLEMILRHGIMGTSMPSFDLLSSTEIDALAEYVKYLSLRGQVEISLIRAAADLGEGEQLSLEREFLLSEVLGPEVEKWKTAPDAIVNPAPRSEPTGEELAASVAKGRELYYGAKANCVKCHGPSALGDGQQTDYDDWQKPIADEKNVLKLAKQALADADAKGDADGAKNARDEIAKQQVLVSKLESVTLPLRTIVPRNLRLGIYRFGRRPLDFYRRVHAGINGAPMPGGHPTLSADEIWQIVDYVESLPYESLSKPPREAKVALQGNM